MFTKLSAARAFVLLVAFTAASVATASACDAHAPLRTRYHDVVGPTFHYPRQFQQVRPANPLDDPNWIVN